MKLLRRVVVVGFLSGAVQPAAVQGQDCFETTVVAPTPLMGNNGEIVKLADGSFWEVKYEYEYMYEYYPTVIMCPSRGLLVIGDTELTVVRVGSSSSESRPAKPSANPVLGSGRVIESRLDGDFEGYDYGNIYRLTNGQLWEQVSATYRYRYRYAPRVWIVQQDGLSRMRIEPLDEWITVTLVGGTGLSGASSQPQSSLSLDDLEGAVIVAADGEPLGKITTNCLAADALCNSFSRYGNEFNSKSIFNEFGRYGSEFSDMSPFNEFASRPPEIVKGGRVIAYLTKNQGKSPRVDPDWLVAMLR